MLALVWATSRRTDDRAWALPIEAIDTADRRGRARSTAPPVAAPAEQLLKRFQRSRMAGNLPESRRTASRSARIPTRSTSGPSIAADVDAAKQLVLVGADVRGVRLDHLQLAGRVGVQGEEREPSGTPSNSARVERRLVRRRSHGVSRTASKIGRPRRARGRRTRAYSSSVTPTRWLLGPYPAERRGEQHGQPVVDAEPQVDGAELRRQRRAHVGVEVGDVDAGGERRLDLGVQLHLDRRRVGVAAHAGHVAPQVARRIDQPGRRRRAG